MNLHRPEAKAVPVSALMTRQVYSCHTGDSLQVAAELLRDLSCECLPVIDDDRQLAGVITYHDICNAAATEELALGVIMVDTAMTKDVISCTPETPLRVALEIMRERQVHRLPVIDPDGKLIGLLSLGTIARAVLDGDEVGISADDILGTLLRQESQAGRSGDSVSAA